MSDSLVDFLECVHAHSNYLSQISPFIAISNDPSPLSDSALLSFCFAVHVRSEAQCMCDPMLVLTPVSRLLRCPISFAEAAKNRESALPSRRHSAGGGSVSVSGVAAADSTASTAAAAARNRWMTVRRVTLGTRSAEVSCWPEMGSVLRCQCGCLNSEY